MTSMSATKKRESKMIQMSRWAINRGLSSIWLVAMSELGGGNLSGGHDDSETACCSEKNTLPGKHKRKRTNTVFCRLFILARDRQNFTEINDFSYARLSTFHLQTGSRTYQPRPFWIACRLWRNFCPLYTKYGVILRQLFDRITCLPYIIH